MVFMLAEQLITATCTLIFSANSLATSLLGMPPSDWNNIDPVTAIILRLIMFGAMIHSTVPFVPFGETHHRAGKKGGPQMMLAETAVLPWAQFGLAGLVIAALFSVLGFHMKQHREERKEMSNAHREERRDWNEEASKERELGRSREESLMKVMTSLEGAIREQGDKKEG